MTWVRISDKVWGDPKIYSLPAGACRLWVLALAWANDHETNGELPSMLLGLLKAKRRDASTLVAAGLWSQTEQGWVINKYLKYQPSKESLEARREATKERVKRHRNGVTNADVTPLVTPPPSRPVPTRPDLSVNVVAKDPTGQEQAGAPPRSAERDEDRETACPLDLEVRAVMLGVPAEFAKHYETSEEAVLEEVREFVAYWTIGAGSGQKRRHWMNRLRTRLVTLGKEKRFKAQGLIEHERTRKRAARVGKRPKRKPEPPPLPQEQRVAMAEAALARIGGKR